MKTLGNHRANFLVTAMPFFRANRRVSFTKGKGFLSEWLGVFKALRCLSSTGQNIRREDRGVHPSAETVGKFGNLFGKVKKITNAFDDLVRSSFVCLNVFLPALNAQVDGKRILREAAARVCGLMGCVKYGCVKVGSPPGSAVSPSNQPKGVPSNNATAHLQFHAEPS